jgi:hypothetical protein
MHVPSVALLGAAVLLFVGIRAALALDYVVESVPSGPAADSVGLDGSGECWTWQHPYDWWYGLSYSVNTNTASRQMTINYLDFWGGDTNPDPLYGSPPNLSAIWSTDSWIYTGSDAYNFGSLALFEHHRLDTYDITLWMYEVISYPANDWITVESRFGEPESGDVSLYCRSTSWLYLDPPN